MPESNSDTITITGPDSQDYDFPAGTTKDQAISYFKSKGIGVQAKPEPPTGVTATPSGPKEPWWSIPVLGKVGPAITDTLNKVFSKEGQAKIAERIKQNVNLPAAATDAIFHGIEGKEPTPAEANLTESMTRATGGDAKFPMNVVKAAFTMPRQVYDMGKSWTQDPTNAVGDIVSGIIMHHVSAPPEETVPPKMSSTRLPLTAEQQAAYTKALDEANANYAQALADYAEKESSARAKWVQKAFKSKQSVADQVAATNKQEILNRGVDEYTKVAQDNIQKTHAAVRAGLDQRWDTLRQGMDGAEIPSADVYNAVEQAKQQFLRGSPASTQQFNNLVKEIGVENFAEDEHGNLTALPNNEPVPWDTARVHSSALGNALSSGNLPGNVYQALKAVRTALEDQLGKAAEARGRGDEYNAVRRDWSNYMNDWQDTSGVNKGGSPLAHALQSPDAPTVTKIINGPAGDRMIGTLAKYKQFGGRPDLLAATRSTAAAADAIKIPRATPTPSPYVPPAGAPEIAEVPVPRAVPKKLGPLAKGVVHVVGGALGAKAMAPTGHTFAGYMAGSRLLSSAVEDMMNGVGEESPAIPPAMRTPSAWSRTKTAIAPAGPGLPAAGAVALSRGESEDADQKAINDAHENIQDFIDSLPK